LVWQLSALVLLSYVVIGSGNASYTYRYYIGNCCGDPYYLVNHSPKGILMSLRFDVSKLEDSSIAWEGDYSSALCNAIVPSLMFIEMGTITEENAGEVYARLHMLEQLCGANRLKLAENGVGTEPVYITPSEVKSFIGLTCNVTTISRNKFYAGIVKGSLDEYKRNYRSATKEKS